MNSLSMDLRKRVFEDCGAGMGTKAVAQRYEVSESWVRRLKPRRRQDGRTEPQSCRNNRRPQLDAQAERIREAITATPDRTLEELKVKLGVTVSLGTLWRAVAKLGLTVKKVQRASKQERPDVKQKRADWKAAQPAPDVDKVVFIDETWARTNMTRRYGRSPKGERLVCPAPHGHWKTTTFVAALRADGVAAPMVIDGAMTGDLFVADVKQILVPTLRPGDVVVMDNVICHKRVAARQAIEAAGGPGAAPATVQPRPEPHRVGVLQATASRVVNAPFGHGCSLTQ
ncbi:Transposase [Gemmata obscuriglobus]|uniref:IS630 family transposase n=1 Tax=Gemmata obscuriglobus TaxID=114 RepID=A0A2Z3GPA6_9BACT|nr:IS630 family transposase [Gemmata obscuriglobus]AWM35633.1 IS630 family transposase [Gemmata obscuriglobus]QEG31838.1 Transposase [Gemmata obscuriglobus]VTS11184.1 transposase : Transposase and inactivated derivatives-like protein OS=Rhodopseudomonas palustris (strain TIE-1) GN=Rpal_1044 PE=4 SV=1: HTH_Tnp_IS630: DDE_3 [Gemmata obscuriglobus UQM 2246]